MTTQEREQLKAEIMADLKEEFKGTLLKEDTPSALSEVRHKWFGNSGYTGKMTEVFESYTAWKIWEAIRKLICLICGEGYVRRLSGKEDVANQVGDVICQSIYELRKRYLNKEES